MNDIPSWMMRDPYQVYARKESMEQAQLARSKAAKAEEARKGLEALFKEAPSGTDNK